MLHAGSALGSYKVVRLLGVGGMGEVYEALDTRLNRRVAIKVLRGATDADPTARQRFEQEARAIAALNHPNICTIHDVGHANGVEYLVMECLEGETLQDRLKRARPPLDDAIEIGIALTNALHAAHAKGIIHRDIKPGNIFLTPYGAKFLDFGLAKSVLMRHHFTRESQVDTQPITETGMVVGTVTYHVHRSSYEVRRSTVGRAPLLPRLSAVRNDCGSSGIRRSDSGGDCSGNPSRRARDERWGATRVKSLSAEGASEKPRGALSERCRDGLGPEVLIAKRAGWRRTGHRSQLRLDDPSAWPLAGSPGTLHSCRRGAATRRRRVISRVFRPMEACVRACIWPFRGN